jgi:Tfp pilus assembly protein PilO
MDLSLTKLPWYGQIGAFVLVCAGAVFGFWNFYVSEVATDIAMRQTHLRALRADINNGVATARRLPEFQAQVTDLERRLESLRAVLPELKDVADTLRRLQGLATQSNLTILRFTPAAQ